MLNNWRKKPNTHETLPSLYSPNVCKISVTIAISGFTIQNCKVACNDKGEPINKQFVNLAINQFTFAISFNKPYQAHSESV